MDVTIRRATDEDADVIFDIRQSAIRRTAISHYSSDEVSAWADDSRPWSTWTEKIDMVVAEVDQTIVGFGMLRLQGSEVRAIYVSPDHGRRGIGRALLGELEDIAKAQGLSYLELDASLNAVEFYESAGFERVAEKLYIRQDGGHSPCLLMRKTLGATLLAARQAHHQPGAG